MKFFSIVFSTFATAIKGEVGALPAWKHLSDLHYPPLHKFLSRRTLTFSPRLTAANYHYYSPQFKRNDSAFNHCNESDRVFLQYLLNNPSQLLESRNDILPFCTDWLNIYRSLPLQDNQVSKDPLPIVLFPNSTEQISKILSYCNERRLPVVPQGGNTGLVGGSVPVFDETVINISKLNKIISFDAQTGILICEAGCILENLNEFLSNQSPSYIVPLDLGAKGSCHIGGNVSTNAGGLRFLRYGSLSGNILGLQAVLADGTILDTTSPLKKDNTGVRLYQLFIGAEGILGIVTKVVIKCPLAPSSVQLCLLKCNNFSQLLEASLECRRNLSDIISAAEFFDHQSLQHVLNHIPGAKNAFNEASTPTQIDLQTEVSSPCFYLLLETHGQDKQADRTRVSIMMEKLIDSQLVEDGIWAENETQKAEVWTLREAIASALSHQGKVFKYDVTLPLEKMYTLVEETRKKLGTKLKVSTVGYGHVGDCNLHLNVLVKDTNSCPQVENLLESWVYEYVCAAGGSISAEHGMGVVKADKILMAKNNDYLNVLKNVKATFDPNGIMNPYKVFRSKS
ncbi:putative D-2-hydroxyglutarate dehydrogenase, mitochondrial [Cardiosporidium cionae]|uniref:D-2-hydroxyglutarate dehydrogenase, mitochondrial n=1 Tax=Cardiosporidium cionae TaxID=476202 RepID=A0ABQ7J6M9_9APIC|nr:putative D-2-hydroxyglutarate dehydrogenase, mitochondrial [Cardiosporidium cionae]|eukprot:KAF8819650.1 putative D-2-hydroxyglutarate dehydrogenase, mitochondrial [Cardiosporidium cionae]